MSYLTSFVKKYIGKFLCKMLLPFIHGEVDCSENAADEARRFLEGISPNPNTSCLRDAKTKSTQEYDLQVIIPAYNAEQYIERCIDSVLNLPTSRNILITVVNDGSTDDTGKVLKKYEGNPMVEILSQENRGHSGARNRALDNLKARYITFLDSDDELIGGGGKIDALLQFVINNDIDILECGYITFSEKRRHDDIYP